MVSWDKQRQLVQAYQQARWPPRYTAVGPAFYEGLTLQKWQGRRRQPLVAIDRRACRCPRQAAARGAARAPGAVGAARRRREPRHGRYYAVNMAP